MNNFSTLLFKTILPKIEIISLLVTALGIGFKIFQLSSAPQLFMIGMMSLASVYFLYAYSPVPTKEGTSPEKFPVIFRKLLYIGGAVTLVGLLFTLLNLEGGMEMQRIGFASLAVGTLASGGLVLQKQERMTALKGPMIRAVGIMIGAFIIYYSLSKSS